MTDYTYQIEADPGFLEPVCRSCLMQVNKLIEEQHSIYVKMTKIRQKHYAQIGDNQRSQKLKNTLKELRLRTIEESSICRSPLEIIDISDEYIDEREEIVDLVSSSSSSYSCRSSSIEISDEYIDQREEIVDLVSSSNCSASSSYTCRSSSIALSMTCSEETSVEKTSVEPHKTSAEETSVEPNNNLIRCKTCTKKYQLKNDLSWHVAECEARKLTLDNLSKGISNDRWTLRPRTRSQCREYEQSVALSHPSSPSARSDLGPMSPRKSPFRMKFKRRATTEASCTSFYKSKKMLQAPSFSAIINLMPNLARKR